MAATAPESPNQSTESLRDQVRSAVIWRSGTQILGQLIAWAATFIVIRLLSPSDYGLFAMTQVVLVLLNMLNGYGLASAVIQRPEIDRKTVRQLFGMLILLNVALACAQLAAAPVAAAYYRQPLVADLLQVQALLYLFTPFIALSYALLSRSMDFKRQAIVTMASAIAGAAAALIAAALGYGVWTLVIAPIVLFGTRAVGMTIAARALMWPSFDFRGAGDVARFGGLMAAGQLFWFIQSQADVFIAGRLFGPHDLGIYTTSLFLTQILVAKFIPPLNEVAFAAYARIQHDRDQVATAFVKSARLVMIVAMPCYFGLAAAADPLVQVMLGAQWREAAPIVHILAFAMPFMTLQVLFAPATDAQGRPGISARTGALGAALFPLAFLIGVQWGTAGLALAWLAAYPIYLVYTAAVSLPVLGVRAGDLLRAVAPPVLASGAMAGIVALIEHAIADTPALGHLALLILAGASSYGALLFLFARPVIGEITALVRHRPQPAA